jgi:hypothetical protein
MTEPRTIGVLTIGQAPRADDTVTELLQVLGPGYAITERGALDDLDPAEIARQVPSPGTICSSRCSETARVSR